MNSGLSAIVKEQYISFNCEININSFTKVLKRRSERFIILINSVIQNLEGGAEYGNVKYFGEHQN